MSFCDEPSFGKGGIEDSNVVLNEEDNNINNNNLSFECLGKNNDYNEDDNSIKNVETQNEIFNQIPMEIENEELDKNQYYRNELFIEHVNYNLNILFKCVNNKLLLRKLHTFLKIKSIADKKECNFVQAEIIFLKIVNSFKRLMRIYRRNQKQVKKKFFNEWKFNYYAIKKINELKSRIESMLEKQNEEEINQLNLKTASIEKESIDLSKNLSQLTSFENELKKKIKNFEEKERTLLDTIKSLENKSTKNKELLNSKTQKSNSSSSECVLLETRVKALENQLASLEEENKERNITLSKFFKEMNEMLQIHEQKFENLEQEELLKRHASPKGNNANLICFTAGSIGNKKVNSGVRNNLSKPKK